MDQRSAATPEVLKFASRRMRLSLRLKSCKDRNETSSLSEDAQQNSRSATWRTPSCQTRRTCRRH